MRHVLLLIILLPFTVLAAPPKYESYSVALHPISKFAPTKSPKTGIDWKMEEELPYTDNDALNFADKYTLEETGCGTGCMYFWLIDRTSGRVYLGPDFNCEFPHDYHGTTGFQYHRDSRLLVVFHASGATYPVHVSYYVWEGTKLKLLETHDVTDRNKD